LDFGGGTSDKLCTKSLPSLALAHLSASMTRADEPDQDHGGRSWTTFPSS
jgi:hypothetical protein